MRTATLTIRDEVNVKIEGLELSERKALVDSTSTKYLALDTCPQLD